MGWLVIFLAFMLGKGLDALKDAAPPPPTPPRPPPRPAHRQATSPAVHRVPVPPRPSRRGSTSPSAVVPASFSAPWPQVVPSGLPAFPGAGWEPDNPPPPAVVSRAQALLGPLWQGGPGTFKAENTAGRWIVYRAVAMGAKKGVVAYRESEHAPFLSSPNTNESDDFDNAPAAPTFPVSFSPPGSQTASLGLPLLKLGSGYQGGPDATSVKVVQQKLGLSPADGKFGPNTDKAVRAFQSRMGLGVDGKVGNQTWAALLGRSA